jgi:hypothetical protein
LERHLDVQESVRANVSVVLPQGPLPVGESEPQVRTEPVHTGEIGNIQEREAIELQTMQIPRCFDLVGEWYRESVKGRPVRLERFCDRGDNLFQKS